MESISMVSTLSAAWGLTLEGAQHFRVSAQREDYARPNEWCAPASNAPRERAQTGRAKRTVLIVEDDPELQKVMIEHVARMDVHVLTASHYAAALAHLESGAPDLACVDIGLPTETGYELCEYIRGTLGLSRLPIMVTSEFGSPQELAYAEEAGANAFLVKPFSMPHLGASISALLDGLWPSTAHILQLGP
jgi:CheY-like chemotaxis protein